MSDEDKRFLLQNLNHVYFHYPGAKEEFFMSKIKNDVAQSPDLIAHLPPEFRQLAKQYSGRPSTLSDVDRYLIRGMLGLALQ